MRLIRSHLLRSLAGPFVFAWAALTGMLLLNHLARKFGELVGKGLPAGVVTEVLLLFFPFIIALTLPMAILVAVLYGFSQLAADNEVTAMRANGVSVLQMLRSVLAAGACLAVVNFLFIDQILPRTNLRLVNLQMDIARKKPTLALVEQTMNDLSPSLYFLQASRLEPISGRMREVTIYDLSLADGRRVIYADSGRMAFEAGQTDLALRLFDGTAHEYKSREPATVRVTTFRTNTIRVRDIENALHRSIGAVQRGDREMTTCEMMDEVARAQRRAARAAREREQLAAQDVRALLRLQPEAPPYRPEPTAKRHCGVWRAFEEKVARLVLPKPAEAATPPASFPQSVEPAILSAVTEVTTQRDDEAEARRRINQYRVEIHKKYTLSVACLNFVLIGVALALRFPRGGIGLVIGGSLVIFALFYVILTVGEGFADDGRVSPALAMWLPNLIVATVGVAGLFAVNREFGSTRGGDLADLTDLLLGRFRRRRA